MADDKRKGDKKVSSKKPGYVGINVYPAAASELRSYAAKLSGHMGVRMTLSDALRMACQVATEHLADTPKVFSPLPNGGNE